MPSKPANQTFGLLLGLAAIVAAAPFLWKIGAPRQDPTAGIGPGEPMPELVAQGWLNGEPLTRDALKGKIVVVHSWFWRCRFCHEGIRTLAEIQRKFADNDDVVFIGLTTDDETDLENVRRFLTKYEVTWPNAYGAAETIFGTGPALTGFKTEYFPGYWVIGRDGSVMWNKSMGGLNELESAISAAVAAS
ncbi:MAG: TlpA family protein disulfide reductase [Planctomycetota bacterium]|jgi:cytochrome oxidase Cu insertion factor (SCO1/SenC/PrrC family)